MSVTITPGPGKPPEGAPSLNVANGNARPLLATVGLDAGEYLCGEIGADEVADALELALRGMQPHAMGMLMRAVMIRAEDSDGYGFTVCASDDRAAVLRLNGLAEVLEWALKHGLGVSWA